MIVCMGALSPSESSLPEFGIVIITHDKAFVNKYFCKIGIEKLNTLYYNALEREVTEMATDSGQNSFRRGVMSLVILGLLKKEDMYGYQLVQETERKSGGRITTQEGSLYPVLYKLVDQGLISDRKVLVGKRMTRVYYHLEPAGEQRLKELIREYEEVTNGVLQIIEGCDTDGSQCPSYAVSMGSARGTAGQQETEETNPVQSRVLRPGFCY